jgi:hypothetical protein
VTAGACSNTAAHSRPRGTGASGTGFDGLRSTADRRRRWGDPVPYGLVRLSAGCEDPADLVEDMLPAFDAVARAPET